MSDAIKIVGLIGLIILLIILLIIFGPLATIWAFI